MCGIAAVWGGEGQGTAGDLNLMLERLRPRGPDAIGRAVLRSGSVGNTRLAIIDVSERSNQPVSGPAGGVLVLNGEILNFRELHRRHLLDADGPISDSLTLVRLLETRGTSVLSELRGMFALAFVPSRDAGELLIARDRFGIKPLYVKDCPGRVVVASEIKAILAVSEVPVEDSQGLIEFLLRRRLDSRGHRTLFCGVEQLEPGTYQWIDAAGGRLRPSRFARVFDSNRLTCAASDTAGRLEEVLTDSVKAHRTADVAVGCLVSGGVDSTTLAMLSQRDSSSAIQTFSVRTPQDTPEFKNLQALAPILGVHRSVDMKLEDIERWVTRVLWCQDEPFADGSMIAHYLLMREIKAAGLKVVLSGQGADEIFGGYAVHRRAALVEWLKRPHPSSLARRLVSQEPEEFVKAIAEALVGGRPERIRRQGRAHRLFSPRLLRMGLAEEHPVSTTDAFQALRLELLERATVPGFLHYEDRNSMAHGVEVRVPYLDEKVVNFGLSQGPQVLLAGGRSKAPLRDVARSLSEGRASFPEGKWGFPSALDEWMRHRRPEVLRWIGRWAGRTGWFSRKGLADVLGDGERARSAAHSALLWRIFVATLWHRMFVEGSARPDSDLTGELV